MRRMPRESTVYGGLQPAPARAPAGRLTTFDAAPEASVCMPSELIGTTGIAGSAATTAGGGAGAACARLGALAGASCVPERGQTAIATASARKPAAAAPMPTTRLRRTARTSYTEGERVIEISD